MSGEELQGEDGVQEPSVERDRGRPVEVLKTADLLEPGLLEVDFEPAMVPAVDLVGQDDLEEGRVVQLLSPGEGEPFGKGVEHGTQLEALEQWSEVRL